MTTSPSSLRSSVQTPSASALEERPALAPVGGHRLDDVVAGEQVQRVEMLAQLPGLGVAEPYPVADAQPVRAGTDQRRLYLAGPLGAGQPQAGRQPRGGLADPAGLAG